MVKEIYLRGLLVMEEENCLIRVQLMAFLKVYTPYQLVHILRMVLLPLMMRNALQSKL